MKAALLCLLVACGGAATPPAGPSAPTTRAAPSVAPGPTSPAASTVRAPGPFADEDDGCPPEWQPGRAPHALGGLTFERTYLKDTGDKIDSYIGERACREVVRCFEAMPEAQRSTTAAYEVVIEWPNSLYEGTGPAGGGFGRSGFGAGGGGGGPYVPTITDAAFTACVTAAIPEEHISTLDDEKRVIRAVRYTVRAYTPPVGDRYFTGTLGHGGRGGGRP